MSTSEGGAAKRWGLAVLIVIGVWGGSVIPAEIIFRLTGRQPADTILGYYEQFGDKGFKIKPFAQTRFNWWSGPFTVRTDALGLRIPDEADPADYDLRPDERLWLVLGDSQAFGNGVPYEKSVVGGMVGRAREEGVYIRNLAVGGYALENQFDLMQWYLDKTGHTPERILLFLTPRVIGDPEARIKAVVKDGEIFDRAPTRGMLYRLYLRSYSAAYLTIRDALKTLNTGPKKAIDFRTQLPFYNPANMDEARYQAFEKVMRKVRDWAQSRQIGFDVAYLPFVVEVEMEHGIAPKSDVLDITAPRTYVKRAAKALDLDVVDLRPIMDKAVEDGVTLSLRGDSHYGHEMSKRGYTFFYDALVTPNLKRPEPGSKETPTDGND